MTWFRVDDTLAFHAKAVAAGNAAMGLWVRAGSWCSQQLTDGYVPAHIAASLGTKTEIKRLVENRLWVADQQGYRFWQWGDEGRQPTREQVEAERAAARERQRRAREKAKQSRDSHSDEQESNAVTNAVTNGEVTGAVTVPPTRPLTEESNDSSVERPRKRGTRLPNDWIPSSEDIAWQREKGISDFVARRELEKFRNHWPAQPGQRGVKLDWSLTWRNWLIRAHETSTKPEPPKRPPGWEYGMN